MMPIMDPSIEQTRDKLHTPEKGRKQMGGAVPRELPPEARRVAEHFLRGEDDTTPKTRLHKKMQGEF